ncbi:hypothetical protein TeGR_g5360 [Tetraparma gracilis]|uniref:EF-hand domain-containing protein n=1 Tax=Tetraparma gracilis TaxID=2962635 RepID=A0ABQ6MEK5_9STRA|nr:hypothetical protein TeGR_g5360 [Tetraparma gracilis]
MGGAVSVDVPLSSAQKEALANKYKVMEEEGMTPRTIGSKWTDAKPAVILFNQIDCDHTGGISRKELTRMLHSLPRSKPKEGVKFVPFEEMLTTLDTDGDGTISLEEWVDNYSKLEGLKAAVDQALDPETGKIVGYQSLEERLAVLQEKKRKEGVSEEDMAKYDKQIASITAQIGSAGVIVFRQIDLDHSGKIDRKELLRVLKQLPKPENATGPKMSIEDIIAALDVDGDGIIDEAEWIANLENLPDLKASVEQAVDKKTGKIKGYRSLEQQLSKLHSQIKDLDKRMAAGEAGLEEELKKREAQAKKLEEKGIVPSGEEWHVEKETMEETPEHHLAELHHNIPVLEKLAEKGVEGAKEEFEKELHEAEELENKGVVAEGEGWSTEKIEDVNPTPEHKLKELEENIPILAAGAEAGVEGAKEELEKEVKEAAALIDAGVVPEA